MSQFDSVCNLYFIAQFGNRCLLSPLSCTRQVAPSLAVFQPFISSRSRLARNISQTRHMPVLGLIMRQYVERGFLRGEEEHDPVGDLDGYAVLIRAALLTSREVTEGC